jgi:hypothetical protein
MESLTWWARHGEAVRQAMEVGALAHSETAREACTEAVRLCAIARGRLPRWARALPDPRRAPAMTRAVRVPAQRAARFAGLDARRNAGSVLRSARV